MISFSKNKKEIYSQDSQSIQITVLECHRGIAHTKAYHQWKISTVYPGTRLMKGSSQNQNSQQLSKIYWNKHRQVT